MSLNEDDKYAGAKYGWEPKIVPRIREGMAQEVIQRGHGATEADLRAASPIPIDWPPEEDAWRAINHIYRNEERLFLGADNTPGTLGKSILPAGEWGEILKGGGCPHPMYLPNPLTGIPRLPIAGQTTNLSDNCIAQHRFVTCELASVPLDRQVAFWRALPHLPVAAITYNGKDALHVLVRVDAWDADEWNCEVVKTLVEQFLMPLGIGASCRNAWCLSRMPGHRRADTGKWQRLLYLAPAGKAVTHAS